MNSPEERTTLAASDHYARRLRQLTDELRAAEPWTDTSCTHRTLSIVERARSAELRDPDPEPYTIA